MVNMEEKITIETYVRKKLEQEVGELRGKILELEFSVLLLTEQKEELTRKISELESKDNKQEENPTI